MLERRLIWNRLPYAKHPYQDWESYHAAAESSHSGDGKTDGGRNHHRDYFKNFFQLSSAKKKPRPPKKDRGPYYQ